MLWNATKNKNTCSQMLRSSENYMPSFALVEALLAVTITALIMTIGFMTYQQTILSFNLQERYTAKIYVEQWLAKNRFLTVDEHLIQDGPWMIEHMVIPLEGEHTIYRVHVRLFNSKKRIVAEGSKLYRP